MPDRYVAPPRRWVRRGRRGRSWQGVFAWSNILSIHPRRAAQHLLVVSVSLAVVLGAALASRFAVSPSDEGGASASVAEVAIEAVVSEIVQSLPAAASPSISTYTVESGDTVKALADRFGLSVATIAAASKLADPDQISVGQELTLLPVSGVLHTPSQGETLGQVAARYGVDPTEVARVNRLAAIAEQSVLGERLVVPGVEPALPQTRRTAVASRAEPASSGDERPTTFASLTLGAGDVEDAEAKDKTITDSAPRAAPKPQAVIYEVQEGDTIRSLANQFGVSIQTILLANELDDPDLIKVGTKLKVLPVSGVEHEVGKGERLADIAAAYKVDLGPIIDFNGLSEPDVILIGDTIVIPGATARAAVSNPGAQPSLVPPVQSAPQAAPARPAGPATAPAIGVTAPPIVGGGGNGVAQNGLRYQGYAYVFGGSSPAGFDCSGFVWYVHKASGIGISRGMWGQLNGGPRITMDKLQPGDTVFFANTYMPGLSHDGIYIGGGRFIHAISEGKGVGISSLSEAYWASRYIGATRLW